jgi:redox-sensitive bicupin YhaK (pirin superfamily)
VTRIVRADERYRSSHDRIESWHCFAAGAHYDPDNVAFGALVGCDEHLVAPEAGFDWHVHRGVEIVSFVVSGALRHQDDRGADVIVRAGEVFVQSAPDGIRHRETNASDVEPLRMVQMTVLSPSDASFETWTTSDRTTAPLWHAFVVDGEWRLAGEVLRPGDSARGDGSLGAAGAGVLLVWKL